MRRPIACSYSPPVGLLVLIYCTLLIRERCVCPLDRLPVDARAAAYPARRLHARIRPQPCRNQPFGRLYPILGGRLAEAENVSIGVLDVKVDTRPGSRFQRFGDERATQPQFIMQRRHPGDTDIGDI
jgi:hypothetical protein